MNTTLDLSDLPKAHLHVHVEAAMRETTLHQLADRHEIELPDLERRTGWERLAALYRATCNVLRTPQDFTRLIDEMVYDNVEEGVVWLEPQLYAPAHRGVFGSDEATVEFFASTLRSAARRQGIDAGLMLAADRTRSPREATQQAALAGRFRDRGVVAFGFVNVEPNNPPQPFVDAFRTARDAGLLITPHAGEMLGAESVAATLDAARPHRIQHGFRAIEDQHTVERLVADDVALDICLESNRYLRFVPDLETHPIARLIEAGVACTLNADDPIAWGSNILHEYDLALNTLGLDMSQIIEIAQCSIRYSAAPDARKNQALLDMESWSSRQK
jgi:adenosine deaminase